MCLYVCRYLTVSLYVSSILWSFSHISFHSALSEVLSPRLCLTTPLGPLPAFIIDRCEGLAGPVIPITGLFHPVHLSITKYQSPSLCRLAFWTKTGPLTDTPTVSTSIQPWEAKTLLKSEFFHPHLIWKIMISWSITFQKVWDVL